MKLLKSLKKDYNVALKRFNNMQEWEKTASAEEQLKYEEEIYKVINELNRLFNQIKKIDDSVEILREA